MTNHVTYYAEAANSAGERVSRLGFWIALLTAGAAAAALSIAITTAPARPGPFCMVELVESCIEYNHSFC